MDRGWVVGRGSWVDGSMVDGRWAGATSTAGEGSDRDVSASGFRLQIPAIDPALRVADLNFSKEQKKLNLTT